MKWKLIKSENGPEYNIFKVRFDYKQNPRNGKTVKVIILEAQDSVNVVAVSKSNEILLIRQHRFGTGQETLELPGGMIDPGETPLDASKRELREETGYTAKEWVALGKIGSNPVYFDNFVHHFFATGLENHHSLILDDAEAIEAVWIPEEDVRQMLFRGAFGHPHTVSALVVHFGRKMSF